MIQISALCSGYDDNDVLHEISLNITKGDFTVILGPNGSGKSTLLYTLIGYLPIRKGMISIMGKQLAQWKKSDLAKIIALIPQETMMPFDYSVEDIVLMGRYPHLQVMQSWSARDYEIVNSTLSRLELSAHKDRFYSQLSGGEKQRVLLARALAQETQIILLDESLSQLDINHQVEMMQLLHDINQTEGKTILLISHQINLAANLASRLIFLKEGRLIDQGSPQEILTQAMLKEVFRIELQLMTNPITGKPNLIFPGVCR